MARTWADGLLREEGPCKISGKWQEERPIRERKPTSSQPDQSDHLPQGGAIAVIFVSMRRAEDDESYGRAAGQMEMLAATQPGFLGIDSARGVDGLGISVSYWADEASALAWRDHAEHRAIRDLGRERWYDHYRLVVGRVERAYAWQREDRANLATR